MEKLFPFIFVQICGAMIHADIDNFKIGYTVSFPNSCHSGEDRIKFVLDASPAQCVKECGSRPACMSLNIRTKFHLCELFSTSEENNLSDGDCRYVQRADIHIFQTSCQSDCEYGQVCNDAGQCVIKECTDLNIPTNGSILGNMRDIGSKIQFKCDYGYMERNGQAGAECTNNGSWSSAAECIKACGPLPFISNGSFILDAVHTAAVWCDSGFESSTNQITCLVNGSWENATCNRKVCGALLLISNGTYVLDTPHANKYLDTATVNCDVGYESAKATVSCLATAVWEHVTCAPKVCGALPSISNGTLELDTPLANKYLDTATVNCDVGHESSKTSITCLATAVWESVTCEAKVCGALPLILYGTIQLDKPLASKYLDTAEVNCDVGHKGSKMTITCQANAMWESVTCEPKVCGALPSISNGTLELDTPLANRYLDTATVNCDVGHESTKTTIICQATAVWDLATCEAKVCGTLPLISNGTIQLNKPLANKYLDTAEVNCDVGHESSKTTISCQANAMWESVTCEPKDCGQLSSIPDGTAMLDIPNSTQYLDTATVTCDLWYRTRHNVINCTASGVWETAICADCYLNTTQGYNGMRNWTEHGDTCLRWEDMDPHYFHDFQYLPDSSVSEAENYCRNPNNRTYIPWCYTGYNHSYYGYCDITECV